MPKKKPILIPLAKLIPTEAIIPQKKWDEISGHYDGKINSISSIIVCQNLDGNYLIENGNKRSAFLHSQGQKCIRGHIHPYDSEEVASLEILAQKAQQQGIYDIEDLSRRVMDLEFLQKNNPFLVNDIIKAQLYMSFTIQ